MRRMVWVLGLLAVAGTLAPAWGWGQTAESQPDKDGVYSMGKGMTPATLVHATPAEYPSDPSLATVKHVVAVRVVIGADGTPGKMELLNAHASPFDDAAIAAVKASQFAPGSYKGDPAPTRAMVWVPFVGDEKLAVPSTLSILRKDLSVPKPLNSVQAEFPAEARKDKVSEGDVLVHMLVTEDGRPSEIHLITAGGHGFDEAALKAAWEYRFEPAKLYGIPVPFDTILEVHFKRS